MPFRSKKQMKYMFANHPEIAKKWVDKYGIKIVKKEKKQYAKNKKRSKKTR